MSELKAELYHDNFQNFKRYNIPKAQLVIADIPYNIGANAYGSNPMWYNGGDNKNGESKFVVFGELHTVESACKKYGVEKPVFYDRKHKGWDLERIFSTPKIEKQGGYRPKGVHVNHG